MTTANYMEKTQGALRDDRVVMAMAVLGVVGLAYGTLAPVSPNSTTQSSDALIGVTAAGIATAQPEIALVGMYGLQSTRSWRLSPPATGQVGGWWLKAGVTA